MSSESDKDDSSDDEEYAPSVGEGSDSEDDDLSKDALMDENQEDVSGPSKEEVDRLWNDFKSDVAKKETSTHKNDTEHENGIPKSKNDKTTTGKVEEPKSNGSKKKEEKQTITVTNVYDFAGEEVKVTKEIDKNSKEAQQHLNGASVSAKAKSSFPLSKMKRPAGGGGLQGLLGKMGKKQKMSTLEKSKLDWQDYKEQEGIQDELNIHNKGKEGYIEKLSFLERTDHRQFEKEREMRMGKVTKR